MGAICQHVVAATIEIVRATPHDHPIRERYGMMIVPDMLGVGDHWKLSISASES